MPNNILATVLAALVPTLIGFIWYHPKVFGTIWAKSINLDMEKAKSINMPKILIIGLIGAFLMAMGMNLIATHDMFTAGSLFYATNKTMVPVAGSPEAAWLNTYMTNYAASNHTFAHGAFHGALIGGIFTIFPTILNDCMWEMRSWKVIAIRSFYWIVCASLMGGIIAAMWK